MVYVAGDLASNSRVRLLDLLCEGPIEGLVDGMSSIYLNDTPIRNADGTYNFKLNETGVIQATNGTGTQAALDGFPSAESYTAVGVDVTEASGGYTATLPTGYDKVRVTVQFPSGLIQQDDGGGINGTSVSYQFQLKKGAGSFVTVVDHTVTGRAQANYELEHEITLDDPAATFQLKMVRITADSSSLRLINPSTWKDYSMVHMEKLRYPYSALVGIDFQSKDFSSVPRRAYDIKGLLVKVPSNYNPVTRAYTGTWDGTFITAWTDNPAWCFYDLCTNTRYGLGRYLDAAQVDKWGLYNIGVLCDELIPDGFGGTEPRFTCNLYLQTREEAFKVLSNMASIFRGMVYWSSGAVTAVSDAPTDAVYLFNRANVVDGLFHYQGSSRKARHNVVLVQWNDPADGYKSKIEYVEDADSIALDGIQQTQVVAFGCTSRGQAHRAGRWLILSERFETDTITFRAGMEGAYVHPGDIVRIQDADKAGIRLGGRIAAGSTTTSINLDQGFTPGAGTYTLHVVMDNGSIESKVISGVAGAVATTAAFSAAPTVNTIWIATSSADPTSLFRVLGVVEAEPHLYDITALFHHPALFSSVDNDTKLNAPPTGDPNPTPTSLGAPTNLTLDSASYVDTDGTAKYRLIGYWSNVTGADWYEVQWRPAAGNWQDIPRIAAPGAQITGLDAGSYEMRVRATNATKASIWITAALTISTEVADDYLTPQEKREAKSEWDQIIADQILLDAAADKAGVSRSTYDTAVTALTTYLDALLDPDGTDAWATGNWLDYTLTLYLGAGGGITFRSKFYSVYQAADALRVSIAQASLAPTDTFRPSLLWNLGDGTDASWTYSNASAADSPSPYAKIGRRITASSTDPQALSPTFSLTGKDARVIVARIRLVSGTWAGEAYFKGTSPSVAAFSGSNYKSVTAPIAGVWTDIAWDMANLTAGGNNYIDNTEITQIRLDFTNTNGAVVDVDWIAVGTYGAGSKADYDNALYWSILGALASGNVTQLGTTVISNGGNLIPNPKSELTAAQLPAGSYGLVAIDSTGLGYNSSTGSRKVLAGVTSQITGRIECKAGEVYYVAAMAKTVGGGTAALVVETFDITGASQGNVSLAAGYSTTSSSYTLIQAQATMPASAASFVVKLNQTAGTYGLFDELGCLHCADAALLVNGSVTALILAAGAVQTYHLSVGPNYQFRSTSGGSPLLMDNAGNFSANTGTGATENANDAAVYMDDTRLYPSGKTKTYEANFSGAQARGFIMNMTSAFATTSQAGLRVLHSGTTLGVYGVTGIGTYSAALKTATVSTSGTEKLTAIYSATSGTADTRRLVIKLDGVEVLVCSDTELTATYNGQKSGYAGLILGDNGTRPGDVKAWGIALGIGSVTVQDGTITGDSLVADLATVNTIRSSNYAAGTASAAPTGFKLAGTTFTTTFLDTSHGGAGGTSASCQMEVGGDVNIAGHKAATVTTRAMFAYNRVRNPLFYQDISGWSSSGVPAWQYDATTRTAGTGSAISNGVRVAGANTTMNSYLIQSFECPPPSTTATLSIYGGWATDAKVGDSWSAAIKVYILECATGTESGPFTLGSGSGTGNASLSWTNYTLDVSSYLTNGGMFSLRFVHNSTLNNTDSVSRTVSIYIDEVTLKI